MRRAVLAILVALALGGGASAQPYETPSALLKAFYKPYLADELPENQEAFRSAALNGLYKADAENTPEGELGAIDFDPYIDGQDWSLDEFDIGEAEIDGDFATVEVSFTNMGEPRVLTYDLVNEDGGWLIDDVAAQDAEFPYRLSEIFAEASGE